MILAAHQPDLLPWTGFWHKMAKATMFDLAIHDQFQTRGYQRRVMMRGSWASLPLAGRCNGERITQIEIAPGGPKALADTITGRYRGAKHWDDRGPALLDLIANAPTHRLWMFNMDLIVGIRDMLGITTPIAFAQPPEGRGTAGLLHLCAQYQADVYLSGTGGSTYMGDRPEVDFVQAGVELRWSRHRPSSPDSIVSTLMDHDDPLSVVMEEN